MSNRITGNNQPTVPPSTADTPANAGSTGLAARFAGIRVGNPTPRRIRPQSGANPRFPSPTRLNAFQTAPTPTRRPFRFSTMNRRNQEASETPPRAGFAESGRAHPSTLSILRPSPAPSNATRPEQGTFTYPAPLYPASPQIQFSNLRPSPLPPSRFDVGQFTASADPRIGLVIDGKDTASVHSDISGSGELGPVITPSFQPHQVANATQGPTQTGATTPVDPPAPNSAAIEAADPTKELQALSDDINLFTTILSSQELELGKKEEQFSELNSIWQALKLSLPADGSADIESKAQVLELEYDLQTLADEIDVLKIEVSQTRSQLTNLLDEKSVLINKAISNLSAEVTNPNPNRHERVSQPGAVQVYRPAPTPSDLQNTQLMNRIELLQHDLEATIAQRSKLD